MKDKNFIIIMILLTVSAVLSSTLYLRKQSESIGMKASNLPMEIGEWKSEDIQLDDRTYEILETRNVVMRKYENPQKDTVYLYTVVSESNRRVAHPPEVCYAGDGLEVTEKEQIKIDIPGLKGHLLVNRFVSSKKENKWLVFYWYKSGNKFTPNYFVQQAKGALNQLMGRDSIAALIRVSTSIKDGDKERADYILRDFSKKLVPLMLSEDSIRKGS